MWPFLVRAPPPSQPRGVWRLVSEESVLATDQVDLALDKRPLYGMS